jgi:hypothetical protein
VRDHDHGAADGDFRQVADEDGFAFRVQRAGRFVQHQDARLGQQGAGDRQALLLAARQVGGILFQQVS